MYIRIYIITKDIINHYKCTYSWHVLFMYVCTVYIAHCVNCMQLYQMIYQYSPYTSDNTGAFSCRYNVQCTMYSVQWPLYTVQYTVVIVNLSVLPYTSDNTGAFSCRYNVQYTMTTVHCTVHSGHCKSISSPLHLR